MSNATYDSERQLSAVREISSRYGLDFLRAERFTEVGDGPILGFESTMKSCEMFACKATDILMLLIGVCDAAGCLSSASLHGLSCEKHLSWTSTPFKVK